MAWEYIYEGIVVDNLQDLHSDIASSNVVGTVLGSSSCGYGISSVIFSSQLNNTNRNRLLTFLRNRSGTANFIREIQI